MLQFDQTTLRLLEEAYHGRDISRRRAANFDALAPRPGQTIVDLGCGNGLLTRDLSRAVGPAGQVHGIDPSDTMLSAARDTCAGRDNVTLSPGGADATGLPDGHADGYVSVQVWEYIADLDAALAETRRILKPGGRAVWGDMHFGTLVWASDDPDRMRRALAAWDGHAVHADLPEHLPGRLGAAGFRLDTVQPVIICATRLGANCMGRMMLHLIERNMVDTGTATPDEATAWHREQIARDAAGRYFFSFTHFVMTATRL